MSRMIKDTWNSESGKAALFCTVVLSLGLLLPFFGPLAMRMLGDEVRGITYYSDTTGLSPRVNAVQAVNYSTGTIDGARINKAQISHNTISDTGTNTHSQIDAVMTLFTDSKAYWDQAYGDRHTHTNKATLDGIDPDSPAAWDAMDDSSAFWDQAYNDKHTHANKVTLDVIAPDSVVSWNAMDDSSALWDQAYSDKHTHANKATLDIIVPDSVTAWDNAVSGGVTSFISRTGAVTALVADYASFYWPLTTSLVVDTDSRLSDPRTPTAHNQGASTITSEFLDTDRLYPSVTKQGNTFNGASQLVQLDGTGKLPAIDGSQLTGVAGATVPDTAITFTNNTTGDVSAAAHGFFPKLPVSEGKFYKDDGTFASVVTDTGAFISTFTAADSTAGDYAFTHNLSQRVVNVTIANNSYVYVIPDLVTYTSTSVVTVNLSSFGNLTGTWTCSIVKSGGSGSGSVTDVTATTPIVSSGGTTPNLTHATSGAVAGSYTNSSVAVDSEGHVTAASSGTASSGGMWTLVERKEFSSAASDYSFTGLNGDSDRRYLIIARLTSAASVSCAIQPIVGSTADSTAGNYNTQRVYAADADIGTDANNTGTAVGMQLIAVNTNGVSYSEMIIDAKSGFYRKYITTCSYSTNNTTAGFLLNITGTWKNSANSIAGLKYISDTSNGIPIGSYIELWKLAQ